MTITVIVAFVSGITVGLNSWLGLNAISATQAGALSLTLMIGFFYIYLTRFMGMI